MKITPKSLIYTVVLFILIGSSLIFVKVNQEALIKTTFEDRSKQQKALFKKIFELSQTQVEALSKDYTYWDEMVEFVSTKDDDFAKDNLDTSLDTYRASAIWVYDDQNQLVYSVREENGEMVRFEELALNPLQRAALFEKKRLVHFFTKTKNGVMNVFAATIHPGDDSERKTEPKGYFYAATILDSVLLSGIGANIGSEIVLETSTAKTLSDEVNPRQGKLSFYYPLIGSDDKPTAFLKVSNEFRSVKDFAVSADREFLIYFVLGVGFFISVFLVIYLQDRSIEHAMKIAEVMTTNLTESEARFRAMNDASPFGILVTDPKGKCIYTNAAYQKLSQQTSEQSWGEGWIEIVHPDDRQRVYAQWYQAASAGGNFSSEHRIKLKDGQEKWVVVKADGIRVEDKLLGYIGVLEDITESKRYKESIEARNADLERMNKSMINRELKMAELKKEIAKLKGGKTNEK